MYTARYGGKHGAAVELAVGAGLVAVRTRSRHMVSSPRPEGFELSERARQLVSALESVFQVPEAGVEVLRHARELSASDTEEVREELKTEPSIEFAGRTLVDEQSGAPVLYTENFFVKFRRDVSDRKCRALLEEHGLVVKRELDYATNAYFAGAPEGTGLAIFEIADALLESQLVQLCHPELVRESRNRASFPGQWHLRRTSITDQDIDAHANCESAWDLSQGAGMTIAIIDDGVDTDHPEFRTAGKVVAPRDVTRRVNDARPGNSDNHGTACAGVACADGIHGASGVAPAARLMPIRLASVLGSQAEADAFVWAAQNGADVISCSWGPVDGRWWDPNDPRHDQVVPLPDSTRLAIDFAATNGRGGKGCIIVWAAGNGNESCDNDGYASYERVIAVGACNDNGKRSAYSDFGDSLWCCFPSSDGIPSRTPGIWTTDRSGTPGYNPGQTSRGDAAGDYTNSFGGTSSACPGVAGVVALMLGRNPELRFDEVRDILRRSATRIDEAAGAYDADGHSTRYGYGRVDARAAVELAAGGPGPDEDEEPVENPYTAVHRAVQDVEIPDQGEATLALRVADTEPVRSIRVDVDIAHTFRGDLVVVLHPPEATGVGPVVLHDRTGGGAADLKQAWTPDTAPALAGFVGPSAEGTWSLEVRDRAARDTGVIRSWGLELGLG